jgi:hypothetical protein
VLLDQRHGSVRRDETAWGSSDWKIGWQSSPFAGDISDCPFGGFVEARFSRKGKVMTVADATIAAVAIYHGIPLITDNVKDFPMKELQLYSLG